MLDYAIVSSLMCGITSVGPERVQWACSYFGRTWTTVSLMNVTVNAFKQTCKQTCYLVLF